jgi:hypothetical protein
MNNDYFIKQLSEVIDEAEAISKRYEDPYKTIGTAELVAVYSKAKSVVARISEVNSEFYKDIHKFATIDGTGHPNLKLNRIVGILKALKSDIEKDYLKTIHQIIQSEVFSEYIDMAEHLLDQGYKDAAAIIAGSTLEAHIKELARTNSIDLLVNDKPKKASTLNDELTKAGIYSSPSQKQVTAWLAIRNDAAHGNYNNYNPQEVKLMIQGIRQFTLK